MGRNKSRQVSKLLRFFLGVMGAFRKAQFGRMATQLSGVGR